MRPVLSCLVAAAAALLLVPEADAAPRGHGWAGPGKHRVHRPAPRFAAPARFHRAHAAPLRHPRFGHHRLGHHRFGHRGRFGPGVYVVGDGWGWGGGSVQTVVVDQQVGQSLTLPVATGIPPQPAAEPVVYVLDAPPRVRKGYDRRPVETGSPEDRAPSGPRVIHLRVPRG